MLTLAKYGLVGSIRPALVVSSGHRKVAPVRLPCNRLCRGRYFVISVAPRLVSVPAHAHQRFGRDTSTCPPPPNSQLGGALSACVRRDQPHSQSAVWPAPASAESGA